MQHPTREDVTILFSSVNSDLDKQSSIVYELTQCFIHHQSDQGQTFQKKNIKEVFFFFFLPTISAMRTNEARTLLPFPLLWSVVVYLLFTVPRWTLAWAGICFER